MHQCEKKPRRQNASSQVDHRQEDTLDSSTSSGNIYIYNPVKCPITSGTSKDNTTNYGTGRANDFPFQKSANSVFKNLKFRFRLKNYVSHFFLIIDALLFS